MLFRKISFYLALIGVVGAVMLVKRLHREAPAPEPLAEPARSPYDGTVAATGLIEAARENVKIASPKGAVIKKIFVNVGQAVRSGDPLFLLDDRESRSRLMTQESQIEALMAALKPEEVRMGDWTDQLERIKKLLESGAATEDERKRREYALATSRAQLESLRAQVDFAKVQLEQSKVELEVLTVRAPREGQILQLNAREGEFAPAAATAEPLMLLGDVDRLQVRAEVDEQNAPLVRTNQPATAFLKGDRNQSMPLRFLRIEPYVVPKRSLTGDSMERVDTRVLQIVFEFDRPKFPVYVGQQVDVFIQRPK